MKNHGEGIRLILSLRNGIESTRLGLIKRLKYKTVRGGPKKSRKENVLVFLVQERDPGNMNDGETGRV